MGFNRNPVEVKQKVDSFLYGYPTDLLTKEEEQRIAALPFGHHDRWKLVRHNIRYAAKVCISFYNRNNLVNDFDALLSVAEDALIYVALNKFKPVGETGADFIGYARYFLKRDLQHEVHRQICIVKLPSLREENRHLLRDDCNYQEGINYVGEDDESCDSGKFFVRRTPETEHLQKDTKENLLIEIHRLIKKPWDRLVIKLYYGLDGGDGMTLAEVSKKLHELFPQQNSSPITEEGIRQILKRCKKKLAKSKILKELAKPTR